MDFGTSSVVFSENELARLPIASMCKIMTLILSFEAIEKGNLSLDDTLLVSERAASMGGSQVFLEANGQYKVRDLIKSIVVCSANDSCVALAERIAGSESLFVEKMNNRAANSYPFNVSPKDYWEEKEKTSNYRIDDDNNGKDQEQYTITVGDISNASDWKSISDSMDDDFLHNQTLEKILKM